MKDGMASTLKMFVISYGILLASSGFYRRDVKFVPYAYTEIVDWD